MSEILQINPEFEQIIPPLSEDEFAQLEENILKLGRVTDPIKVWNGVIIDGHHRYKIIQKYPEIPYSTYEMNFESEHEAVAWMCSAQLGRRNITEAHRQYILGKRYDAEKHMNGGDRRSEQVKSVVQIGPLKSAHSTREKIAKETNTNPSYIKNCDRFARGVDAAEEVFPGIKKKILLGEINPTKSEIYALAKIPKEKRKEDVELLLIPKDERKANEITRQIEDDFGNGAESDEMVCVSDAAKTGIFSDSDEVEALIENHKEKKMREIEESIIHSMYGTLNMFIESINDYLTRFPRLITEPKYRDQTRELMVAAQNYIKDVEGALK